MARSFLRCFLAAGGKLGDRAARRGLGHLPACIRIDFGVKDQHIYIFARAEHVIEAAEADVVSPSVAADDPDALADQGVGDGQQFAGIRRVEVREFSFEFLRLDRAGR